MTISGFTTLPHFRAGGCAHFEVLGDWVSGDAEILQTQLYCIANSKATKLFDKIGISVFYLNPLKNLDKLKAKAFLR